MVEEGVEEAQEALRHLAEAGIDLHDTTERRLVEEGVQSFADSYDQLIAGLRKKRAAI